MRHKPTNDLRQLPKASATAVTFYKVSKESKKRKKICPKKVRKVELDFYLLKYQVWLKTLPV